MAPKRTLELYVPPALRQKRLGNASSGMQVGANGVCQVPDSLPNVPGSLRSGDTPHTGSSAPKFTPRTVTDSDLALPEPAPREPRDIAMPRRRPRRKSSFKVSAPSPSAAQSRVEVANESSVVAQRSPAPVDTILEAQKFSQRGRKSTWIKDKDIPKPRKWSLGSNAWGSPQKGEDVDDAGSAWADNGFGSLRKRVEDYGGYNLQDWDGGWAPAPVDWEERGCFKDQKWGERIHHWLGSSAVVPRDKIDLMLEGACNRDAGDMAPKAWIPECIDGDPASVWWAAHLNGELYEGPPNAKPWWELYRSEQSQILPLLMSPPTKKNPPEESKELRSKRLQDAGSIGVSLNHVRKIAAAKEKKQRFRDLAKRDKEAARERDEERIKRPRPFYIRAADKSDILAITEIYNKHVQDTFHCLEPEPLTCEAMGNKYSAIVNAMLPIMVAVKYTKTDNWCLDLKPASHDQVIGFAYANEHDENGMFRNTCAIDIQVAPDYRKKKVGDALMDRMSLSLSYRFADSRVYHHYNKTYSPYDYGPVKSCASITARIPFPADDEEHLKWISKWLVNWDFEQVGIYKEVAVKSGKKMNLALFQRLTNEEIREG